MLESISDFSASAIPYLTIVLAAITGAAAVEQYRRMRSGARVLAVGLIASSFSIAMACVVIASR